MSATLKIKKASPGLDQRNRLGELTVGRALLAPTRLYLDEARAIRARTDVRAFAHVTGGGILGNLQRVLPEGLRARVDWSSWKRLPVFEWLARHVDEEELRRVFNLGIGFCAVVSNEGDSLVIGRVESGEHA